MRTEQEVKEDLEFEASIGMEEFSFSGDAKRFDALSKALDALVKKFSGSDIPCNFDVRGCNYCSWGFMIDEENLDAFTEKLEKLESDFGNDG